MCGCSGSRRCNYFVGEIFKRTEGEVRVGKIKNGKAAYKGEVTRELIKNEGELVIH